MTDLTNAKDDIMHAINQFGEQTVGRNGGLGAQPGVWLAAAQELQSEGRIVMHKLRGSGECYSCTLPGRPSTYPANALA